MLRPLGGDVPTPPAARDITLVEAQAIALTITTAFEGDTGMNDQAFPARVGEGTDGTALENTRAAAQSACRAVGANATFHRAQAAGQYHPIVEVAEQRNACSRGHTRFEPVARHGLDHVVAL
jgi:hypothetical protein